ncbi:MAG: AbrB/MazE/SpoVT family DNA-binding domain-containing protein [archaeon]
MVNISVTRMSSKGQIVIPANMRVNFKEGDEIVLIKDDERIILKKADKFTEHMKEDLEFARRTEEAYRKIEAGEGIRMDFDDFIKEMEKWCA